MKACFVVKLIPLVVSCWTSTSSASRIGSSGGEDALDFPCAALESFVACDGTRRYLAAGSYGQVWLVKDAKVDRMDVVKLLYHKTADGAKFLTRSDVRPGTDLALQFKEAKAECEVARALQKPTSLPVVRSAKRTRRAAGKANATAEGSGGILAESQEANDFKGKERIMRCFGNNLGTREKNVPLFLVTEYSGDLGMHKYLEMLAKENRLTLDLLRQLFKQLLEALNHMASYSPPWIHHDLKPENIVIKEQNVGSDSKPVLRLIDFGGSVNPALDKPCGSKTPATLGYAPSEWDNPLPDGGCQGANYDPKYPAAFDMFAAGAIFFESVTGANLTTLVDEVNELLGGRYPGKAVIFEDDVKVANFQLIRDIVTDSDFLPTVFSKFHLKETTLPGYNRVLNELKINKVASEFFRTATSLLLSAKERPTASDLMKHPWMQFDTTDDEELLAERGFGVSAAVSTESLVKSRPLPWQPPVQAFPQDVEMPISPERVTNKRRREEMVTEEIGPTSNLVPHKRQKITEGRRMITRAAKRRQIKK